MTAYLQEPFFEWFYEKISRYMKYEGDPIDRDCEYFFNEIGFTSKEFLEKFIEPYKNLTFEQIKKIGELQSQLSRKELGMGLFFEIDDKRLFRRYNAALWTLFQISELNLFEFSNLPLIDSDYVEFMQEFLESSTPNQQCYYCGKPYEDEYGNKFNDKTSYCFHTQRAKGVLATEGKSCTSEWRILSQGIRRDIERVEKKKLKKYEKYTQKEEQEEITRIFRDFCEKLYEHNLNNKYTIQSYGYVPTPDGLNYQLIEAKLVKDLEV